jgi:hypothetical protein
VTTVSSAGEMIDAGDDARACGCPPLSCCSRSSHLIERGLVENIVTIAKLKDSDMDGALVHVDGLTLDEAKLVLALAFREVDSFPETVETEGQA